MSSALYRNYLRLLEKWPADVSKKGRDLGEFIRTGIAVAFRGGTDEPKSRELCEEIYSRLNNIASNRYKETFYVSDTRTASGLSQADCQQVVSNEFLKLMEEEDKSLKDKLRGYFKS